MHSSLRLTRFQVSHNQNPGSEGQSQPELGVAAFVVLYVGSGRPFSYQVLIVIQELSNFCPHPQKASPRASA